MFFRIQSVYNRPRYLRTFGLTAAMREPKVLYESHQRHDYPRGELGNPARHKKEHRVNTRSTESEPLLTPAEVAAMFRVDPKTVTRWAKAGKLSSIRTLGGHRRYRESEVRELLAGVPGQRRAE